MHAAPVAEPAALALCERLRAALSRTPPTAAFCPPLTRRDAALLLRTLEAALSPTESNPHGAHAPDRPAGRA